MRRSPLLLCALAASLLPGLAAADPAMAILRNTAMVQGDHILLGELFDNAGSHAADEVAAAPPPGASTTFSAGWLAETAKAHGLAWQAPSPLATIRVERAATEIGTAEIAMRIAAALGINRPDRSVMLDNTLKLYAPASAGASIGVEHLDLDRQTERFTAEIRVPADDPAAPVTRVSGRVQTMVAVAVPTRNLMPGDVIGRDDVSVVWLRAELAPSSGAASVKDLIGRTPRRPLRADQPLRANDAEIPVVVKRNDLVLMVLEEPGMSLTAQGKALEDGGTGSAIRVTNIQSNRIVEATVTGAGQVAVRSAGTIATAY